MLKLYDKYFKNFKNIMTHEFTKTKKAQYLLWIAEGLEFAAIKVTSEQI